MQIIDTHQHFWTYDPLLYDWIDHSMSPLKQNFLPADLHLVYQEANVEGCIAVQAASTEAETTILLDYADHYDFIKGVVGWVDLLAENVKDRLKLFSDRSKFKGVRHIIQSESPEFMERPEFLRGIAILSEFNLTYDILIYPKHLFTAYQFAQKFPNQKFVIDHMAKPMIKHRNFNNWKDLMQNFASLPNVFCKVSGMITEADWKQWGYKDFLQPLDTVVEVFGADRLMYGSDWPVCLLAGSYKNVLDIIKTYTNNWSDDEKEKIFYKNATQFYNLVP